VPPRLVPDQISVQIAKAAKQGSDHIDIRLTPQALGRVTVHLEVAQDGWVKATVVADIPQVLDALKAEARALERALQDAGLKADSGSLSFSLRGDGGQSHAEGFERREAPHFSAASMNPAAAEAETMVVPGGLAVSTGRVDICA
jgi:flagellar hook-length control protein FliK